jgi:hypothetical protein
MHTHNFMCNWHYYSAYVQCLQPATCLLLHRNHVTHGLHFSFPTYTCDSVSVFIRLWCMDNKMSWLCGWASQWHPPQGHRSSGILCSLGWKLVSHILGQPIGPIFKCQAVWPWMWDQYAVPMLVTNHELVLHNIPEGQRPCCSWLSRGPRCR